MNDDAEPKSSIWQSIAGWVMAFAISIIVNLVAYYGIYLLDMLRGLDNNVLQAIFRATFPPALGAYAGLHAVNLWLTRASLRFVFWAFSTPFLLSLAVVPTILVFLKPEHETVNWAEQGVLLGAYATSVIGAYVAYRQLSSDRS